MSTFILEAKPFLCKYCDYELSKVEREFKRSAQVDILDVFRTWVKRLGEDATVEELMRVIDQNKGDIPEVVYNRIKVAVDG